MEKEKTKKEVGFLKILSFYWPHIKRYKVLVVIDFLLAAAASVLSGVISPIVYQHIIDTVTGTSIPVFSPNLKLWFIIFICIAVFGFIIGRLNGVITNYLQSKIMERLANDVFSKLLKHSRSFFANNFSGSLVAKSGRFVRSFETIYETTIFNFWAIFVTLLGIFIVLFKKNSTLGFIFLGCLVIFVIISFLFMRYKFAFDAEKAAAESKTTGMLSDVISNILSLKVFSSFFTEFKNYQVLTAKEGKIRFRGWLVNVKQATILNILMVSLRMFSLYLVINMWVEGKATIGFIVLVQLYTSQIFDLVWNFSFSIRSFGRSVTDAKEMVEIFETPIDIKDPFNPEKCKIKNGEISFENISFTYKDGKDVFKDFNLKIKAGEKIGFVGQSGSGKTTITNLLLRFEDVQSGVVKIDGQDIRNISQDDLRRNVSYVPQEPALFHRTLRENISYGKPDATEEEIVSASRKAHAHEFISEFKDGYETLVGERGIKLSGGQRQRVAIARVMLKDSPILMLDEATSSLDSISENYIQQAFDEAMKNRTTIVIAHRLSTIQKMDRIVVLDKGSVVEDGTHTELLSKNGYYAKLWQAQKGGMI